MKTSRLVPQLSASVFGLLGFAATALTSSSAEAAKPPAWCGDYKSKKDDKARWIDGYINSEGYSLRVLNYMAMAACDKPRDKKRQADVARWREGYAGGLLDDAQFAEAMALHLDANKYKQGQQEQCAKYEGWKQQPFETGMRMSAMATAVCNERPEEDFIALNDWSGVAELDRLLMLTVALPKPAAADISLYPYVGADLKALDLKKLESEIKKLSLHERVALRERAGRLKVQAVAAMEKDRKETLAKHPEYAQIIAAADEGWAAWHQTYKANRAAMDLGRNFELQYLADSEKVSANCVDELLEPLAAHMASKKPKDVDEAKAAASDMVGHRLLWNLVLCANLRNDPIAAHAFATSSLPATWRGPRTAAYNFAQTKFVMNGWQGNKNRSPTERTGKFLGGMYANAATTARSTRGYPDMVQQLAQVKTVKPSKQEGKQAVVFNKVKVKYREQNCKEDTSKWEIYDNGQIGHPTYCELGALRTRTHHEWPILVQSKLATKSLKAKNYTTWFVIDEKHDGSPRDGFPLAVYADPQQTKLIGYFGVTW